MKPNFKIKKERNRTYRKWLATELFCIVCGRTDCQAAHIRKGNSAGAGLKSGDDCCVPLCLQCHREQGVLQEERFWLPYGGHERATALAKALFGCKYDHLRAYQLIMEWKNG